jgi:hypothetical protein
MAFLADGSLLVSAPMTPSPDNPHIGVTDSSLEQIDIETGQRLRYVKDIDNQIKASWKMMYSFAVSKNSTLVAGIPAGDNKIASIFRTDNWSWQSNMNVPQNCEKQVFAKSLDFSPNSEEIAIGTYCGKMDIYAVKTGKVIHKFDLFPVEFSTNAVGFSPDGNYLAAGKKKEYSLQPIGDAIKLYRTSDWSSIPISNAKAEIIWSLAWSSNDELAIGDNTSLKVWKINTEGSVQTLNVTSDRGFYSVQFASDGRLAAATRNEVWIYKSFD